MSAKVLSAGVNIRARRVFALRRLYRLDVLDAVSRQPARRIKM
jgi:hypothetical protein